jgi:hypothetical protein
LVAPLIAAIVALALLGGCATLPRPPADLAGRMAISVGAMTTCRHAISVRNSSCTAMHWQAICS